jgi:hypothetical protein
MSKKIQAFSNVSPWLWEALLLSVSVDEVLVNGVSLLFHILSISDLQALLSCGD